MLQIPQDLNRHDMQLHTPVITRIAPCVITATQKKGLLKRHIVVHQTQPNISTEHATADLNIIINFAGIVKNAKQLIYRHNMIHVLVATSWHNERHR